MRTHSFADQLQRLLLLRSALLVAQGAAVVIAQSYLRIDLAWRPLLTVLVASGMHIGCGVAELATR